jgi:hypothetical protein
MRLLYTTSACLLLLSLVSASRNHPLAQPAMSPYMKECKDAGVPLPPNWPDAAWKKREPDLPKEKVFDADPDFETPTTEVRVYETELGFCYALPRKDKDDAIMLLGIICQGKKSGKACFWDNVKPGTKDKIQGKDIKLDPAKIADGSNLQENCTNCHRGDNVFAITPRTALDLDPTKDGRGERKTDVDTPPYQPLSGGRTDAKWTNPARPADDPLAYPGKGCSFCHSIPVVTKEYCGLVNRMIRAKAMPPNGKLDADYNEDVARLKKECAEKSYTWID